MSKYNYDKAALKGLGVGPFLGEVKLREAKIAEAPAEDIKSIFNANIVAKTLHPHIQNLKVVKVEEDNDAKTFTFVGNEEKGTEKVAFFRAGQYLSVVIGMDGKFSTKPYTIASAPSFDEYKITVKKSPNGYASEYILNNWDVGTEVMTSGPLGNFYYQELRDAKHIVAAAGGSGITPFLSMAGAVVAGLEDFDLTILYGSKTEDSIICKKELDKLVAESNGKVNVVYVLSDEEKDGYEKGFVTADLIKKYGTGDYSLYVCGPKAMYDFLKEEVKKLDLPRRRIRFEVPGESKVGAPGEEYNLTVWARGEKYELKCKSDETLLHACEEAGIGVTTDCRSGICGWCRSRLISGEIKITEDADGRRAADKKFGWIHPCATFPLSDIEMEVFPVI